MGEIFEFIEYQFKHPFLMKKLQNIKNLQYKNQKKNDF
jgi:hypothetical protein